MTGRYRLVESIGQGGMGRVWRAADEMLDRQVAVKEMRIDGLDAEDTRTRRERTLREARATARIDHPNVVRVYDVVDEGERLWIVMELVRGRSLERIMVEDGPLGPAETARIGLGLVEALRQVHARGVLHRDIKPGNVLVESGERGGRRVVLTDFGIAAMQDAKALTMVGMLVGSPDYMAPERIAGRPQGPPSDIWSLGATLCAALGGRSPFSRDTTLATLHAVLYEEPQLPSSAGPLTDILAALLEKDPTVRPALEDLHAALRPIAFPASTPTMPVGGGEGVGSSAGDLIETDSGAARAREEAERPGRRAGRGIRGGGPERETPPAAGVGPEPGAEIGVPVPAGAESPGAPGSSAGVPVASADSRGVTEEAEGRAAQDPSAEPAAASEAAPPSPWTPRELPTPAYLGAGLVRAVRDPRVPDAGGEPGPVSEPVRTPELGTRTEAPSGAEVLPPGGGEAGPSAVQGDVEPTASEGQAGPGSPESEPADAVPADAVPNGPADSDTHRTPPHTPPEGFRQVTEAPDARIQPAALGEPSVPSASASSEAASAEPFVPPEPQAAGASVEPFVSRETQAAGASRGAASAEPSVPSASASSEAASAEPFVPPEPQAAGASVEPFVPRETQAAGASRGAASAEPSVPPASQAASAPRGAASAEPFVPPASQAASASTEAASGERSEVRSETPSGNSAAAALRASVPTASHPVASAPTQDSLTAGAPTEHFPGPEAPTRDSLASAPTRATPRRPGVSLARAKPVPEQRPPAAQDLETPTPATPGTDRDTNAPQALAPDAGAGQLPASGTGFAAGAGQALLPGTSPEAGAGQLSSSGAGRDAGAGQALLPGTGPKASPGQLPGPGVSRDAGAGQALLPRTGPDVGAGQLPGPGASRDAGAGQVLLPRTAPDAGAGQLPSSNTGRAGADAGEAPASGTGPDPRQAPASGTAPDTPTNTHPDTDTGPGIPDPTNTPNSSLLLGPHPLRTPPPHTAHPHRRTAILVALAAAITAGAVVVAVLLMNGSPDDNRANPSTSIPPSASASTTGPSPTVEGTSRPPLPPGTRNESGLFTWIPPDGWKRTVFSGSYVRYTSPDGTQEIWGRASMATKNSTLLQNWEQEEATHTSKGQGYRRIRLEETTFQDRPAVAWEYTVTTQGEPWHARLLGFRKGRMSYEISTWYQADTESTAVPTYEKVRDSFTAL
ncbi:protein kinase [Streptomyces sp. NPDC047072]|uniref:serine/threonine-protein kinase n=1 Tax=Streptomyces sp. NPDC047072 TaxID=3154809 RepID=UPI0033E210F8